MRVVLVLVLAGCTPSPSASSPAPDPATTPAVPTAEPAKSATVEAKKEPTEATPPFVLENLSVSEKTKGAAFDRLDLAWSVRRRRDDGQSTVLFIHAKCRVGYVTKEQEETASLAEVTEAPRSYKSSMALPSSPTWCIFRFAHGPKGGPETPLATYCWKDGALTDGTCS